MNCIKSIFFIVASFLWVAEAYAQTLSVKEQVDFNLKALQLIDDYSTYAAISGQKAKDPFLTLFESGRSLVYNDLYPVSSKEMKKQRNITAQEYADLMANETSIPEVFIRNVNKVRTYTDGQNWFMEVSFDKALVYGNTCDVMFDTENLMGKCFKMLATLIWNSKSKDCKIRIIEGTIDPSKEPLFDDFEVIKQSNKRDYKLYYKGRPIRFDKKWNQAFLPLGSVEELTYPKNNEVRVSPVYEDECDNVYHIRYHSTRWRLKPNVGIAMGKKYDVKYGINDTDISTSCIETGVDVGYVLYSRKKVRLTIFTGLGVSKGNIDFSIPEMQYDYFAPSSADIDGDTYQRYYHIHSAAQSLKITDIYVPLYLDYNITTGRAVSFYLDFGAKLYMNMNASETSPEATYSTYGIYPQYEDLCFDASSGLDQFVNEIHLSSVDKISTGYKPQKSTWDIMEAFGVRFNLSKVMLLDLGFSFQQSVTPFWETNGSLSGDKESTALMFYDGEEHFRNVTTEATSIKRKFAKFNLGLIFKF